MNLVKMCKEAQGECDRFNTQYPIGTKGRITRDDGKVDDTCVKHPAQVMGSSAVAFFEGISGAYLLKRFTPNEKVNHDFGRELEQINAVPEERNLSVNKSYRNNLIERLEEFLEVIKEEGEECKALSHNVKDRAEYYKGGKYVAVLLAGRFKLLFPEELRD